MGATATTIRMPGVLRHRPSLPISRDGMVVIPQGSRTVSYAECVALARCAAPEAMKRLIELMRSPDERISLMAADKVLERAWGKPKEQKDDTDDRLKGMTLEQKKARIRELLAYAVKVQAEAAAEREGEAVEVPEVRPKARELK